MFSYRQVFSLLISKNIPNKNLKEKKKISYLKFRKYNKSEHTMPSPEVKNSKMRKMSLQLRARCLNYLL